MAKRYVPCTDCGSLNSVNLETIGDKQPKCGNCKTNLDLNKFVFSVNEKTLVNAIASCPIPVVVDFWAPWCGPCKSFAPTYEHHARNNIDSALYLKLDTEAEQNCGMIYNIRSIPTLIVFNNKTEKNRVSGAMQGPQFKDWLKQNGVN